MNELFSPAALASQVLFPKPDEKRENSVPVFSNLPNFLNSENGGLRKTEFRISKECEFLKSESPEEELFSLNESCQ